MLRIVPAGIITGCTLFGAAAGNFLEEHNMSLPAILSVAGMVLPATWWISRRLAKIDSKFELTDQRVQIVEASVKNSLERIEAAISVLPCHTAFCAEEKRTKIKPRGSGHEP